MKKVLSLLLMLATIGSGQEDMYSREYYTGSGIGYSQILLRLDYSAIGALDQFSNLGLDQTQFRTPFLIHGGEGFSNISANWRLGGFAGLGSSQISTMDTSGGVNKSVDATFSLMLGAAIVEFAIPIFSSFEIATGLMFGVGRANLLIGQSPGSPGWDDQFSLVYGDSLTISHSTNLSGTFFNLQPYLAIKWQILDRVGMRISAGFNQGTIAAGGWTLNNREPISNSPESVFEGLAIRTMLYFGL